MVVAGSMGGMLGAAGWVTLVKGLDPEQLLWVSVAGLAL